MENLPANVLILCWRRYLQENQLPLSLIYNNSTNKVIERSQTHLLRPIFINGVEVGFAYAILCSNLNLYDNQFELDTFSFYLKLIYFVVNFFKLSNQLYK